MYFCHIICQILGSKQMCEVNNSLLNLETHIREVALLKGTAKFAYAFPLIIRINVFAFGL